MIRRTVSLPEIGLIAVTRAIAGLGIGLLIADKLNKKNRRALGWTFFTVGALSTIPLAARLLMRGEPRSRSNSEESPDRPLRQMRDLSARM